MLLPRPLAALLLLLGLAAMASGPAHGSHTIWHSPLNHSTADDLELRPYYNPNSLVLFPLPQVPGTFQIQFPLTVPSNVVIDAVTICYRGFSADNRITRIVLDQMTGPTNANPVHEEEVSLNQTTDTCYTSVVGGLPVEGTMTLTLEFVFDYVYDSILIGAIGIEVSESTSGVMPDPSSAERSRLLLQQNRPNPFRPPTVIEYTLTGDAPASIVSVDVLDVTGRLVRQLATVEQGAGDYRLSWNGTNDDGARVPAGTYYYRVRTPEEEVSRGMLLLR